MNSIGGTVGGAKRHDIRGMIRITRTQMLVEYTMHQVNLDFLLAEVMCSQHVHFMLLTESLVLNVCLWRNQDGCNKPHL
jgi:hypothetical protein